MRERGTTLLEVVMVAAIGVLIAAAVTCTQGARFFAMRSAAVQFDAAFNYAQAAAAGNDSGAALVFEKRSDAQRHALPGFRLTVQAANAQAVPATSAATVVEAGVGAVPFTIALDAAGHAVCPPAESAIVLTFSDGRSSDRRTIPCNEPLGGVPASIGTPPP